VNCAALPAATVWEDGLTEIVSAETVRFAPLEIFVLATEVAVIVIIRSDVNGPAGAMYVVALPLAVAVGETEPHCADAHVTVQETPFALGSFATLAEACAVPPASNVVGVTVTVTVIGGGGGGVWLVAPPQA